MCQTPGTPSPFPASTPRADVLFVKAMGRNLEPRDCNMQMNMYTARAKGLKAFVKPVLVPDPDN